MQKLFIIITLLISSLSPMLGNAQESFNQNPSEIITEYIRGSVIDTSIDENGLILYQTELTNGEIISVDSFGEPIALGDKIFLEYFPQEDIYNFVTVNRNTPLYILLGIFVFGIIILAGKKGARSLVSLGFSFLILFLVLVPLLLQGYNPLWTTLGFGLAVLFLSIFVTHGFNRQSLVSFIGAVSSIIVSVILLTGVEYMVPLTGLINDSIQFLDFETQGILDLYGIVSAGIIIGILGVLDDITITQVAVVRELSSENLLSKKQVFLKSLRVGRDHISSLVNTLVFAYVGATLPLIMFIQILEIPFFVLISQEFIFVEIIRSLIGAIGLTLAVPVTTYLAVFIFQKSIIRDKEAIASACAHHHN